MLEVKLFRMVILLILVKTMKQQKWRIKYKITELSLLDSNWFFKHQ